MRYILILLLTVLGFYSCKTHKTEEKICKGDFRGYVLDKSELDGCGLIIVTSNGNRIEPIFNDEIIPKPGEIITFNYRQSKMMSTCMYGNVIGILSCVEVIRNTKSNEPCTEIKSIENLQWLKELIITMKPSKVYEYSNDQNIVFLIETNKSSIIFDCHGSIICSDNTLDNKNCSKLLNIYPKPILLWERDEVPK